MGSPKRSEKGRGTELDGYPAVGKVNDAARVLQVGPNRIRALVASGELRSVRLGPKSIRIPREALKEFLAGNVA